MHYHALFFVCSYTGLRRGEVLGLKWEDFDSEEGTLHVQRNLIYDKLGFRFGPLKTEASDRIIKLDDSIMNVLKLQKKRQAEMKLLFGASYGKEDLIFSREDGQPIYPRTLTTIFNRIVKKAEVPKIGFHDLRHTHATLLLEAGVSLKEVQERLGHSSIKMTGDIYAHVTNTMKTNSAEKFSQYMQKTAKVKMWSF
ncbi:site-specific integrase [Priestia endophytica]|uniref:site-specific integrase n=1 Tax=Priestia endophytica TaxID=135735 RepID=UPI00227E7729|nr:site-specific integrase [Priestia endophytica]